MPARLREVAVSASAKRNASRAARSAPGVDSEDSILRVERGVRAPASAWRDRAGPKLAPPLATRLTSAQPPRDLGASDVHVIAGRPMLPRVAGDLAAAGRAPRRGRPGRRHDPRDRARAAARGHSKSKAHATSPLDRDAHGRFRVNVCAPAHRAQGVLPAASRPACPRSRRWACRPRSSGRRTITRAWSSSPGPTGHGKTSTLAAIVDIINRETTHHVITVEDPVEYVHPRKKAMISQREVGTHTKSFASGAQGSPPRGSRRHRRRRAARHRDGAHGARRERDGTPRARDDEHAERRQDDRPPDRSLPARRSAAGAHDARRAACTSS